MNNQTLIPSHQNDYLLIVDDENIQKIMLKNPLERNGINVIFNTCGKECIKTIKENKNIKLILVDLLMPNQNGFDTFTKIKKLFPLIPIIAISASVTEKDKAKAIEFGFNDLLIKPLKIKEIEETFYNCCQLKLLNPTSIQTPYNNNEQKEIITHLTSQQENLNLGIEQQNLKTISKVLHGLRENILIEKISTLNTQIKKIQLNIQEKKITIAELIDLNEFLKHFIISQKLN